MNIPTLEQVRNNMLFSQVSATYQAEGVTACLMPSDNSMMIRAAVGDETGVTCFKIASSESDQAILGIFSYAAGCKNDDGIAPPSEAQEIARMKLAGLAHKAVAKHASIEAE